MNALLELIENAAKKSYTPILPFAKADKTALEQLTAFEDLAVVVNAQVQSEVESSQIHLLLDLLFSPTTPRWEPFVHNLDFPRTISKTLIGKIIEWLDNKGLPLSRILLSGASATGKTIVLKRAAFELAKLGYFVIWFRDYFYQDGPSQLRKLFDKISTTGAHNDRKVVIFMDDPIALGTLKPEDVASALNNTKLEAVLITSARTTDLAINDGSISEFLANPDEELIVPDQFDDVEWAALAQYLVTLKICPDIPHAKTKIANSQSMETRDVLSMLFYLLPETRQWITASVRDELFRLGDRAAFSKILLGEINHSSILLKTAYEMAAVASKYGCPVPIEVLVSALNVGYDEWLAVSPSDGTKWGLLYEESSHDSDTILYKTRNDIVTKIIVESVNGGSVGRSGELSILSKLVSACNGQSPPYREFCVRLLVPHDRNPIKALEYDEGAPLYERAISALPFEDKTLLHHKGLWQKNKGHDSVGACVTLQQAINAKDYPYASRSESNAHIYTSIAATQLAAIRAKQIDPDEGKKHVLSALERARPEQYFDPHAVHVQANLIVQLADATGTSSNLDSLRLMERAMADVDRMLFLMKSNFGLDPERKKSFDMLEQARSDIIDRCASDEHISEDAERLWKNHQGQEGFALIARRLYGKAVAKNTAGFFKRAFDYILEIKDRIQKEGHSLSSHLEEIMLQTYFQWRVRLFLFHESLNPIDWQLIGTMASNVLRSTRSSKDPLYSYILAIAKAHLDDWSGASAIFRDLRNRVSKSALWEGLCAILS